MGFKRTAGTDIIHSRRIGKLLTNDSKVGSIGVTIRSSKVGTRWVQFRTRTAVITTGKSDFNDPMEALRQAIHASIDREEQRQPVRIVVGATATPMDEVRGRPSKAHYKSAMKRVPRGFARMWQTWRRGIICWFFMYTDKVLCVSYSRATGWVHKVVPEEGLST